MSEATKLNQDAALRADRAALEAALDGQGAVFRQALGESHAHLFAAAPVFVSPAQLAQMREVIAAVERVVNLTKGSHSGPLPEGARGVFFGYDFHLNADGAHLIEINTNAGGAFLNALLFASQRGAALPGEPVAAAELEQVFLAMFRRECGAAPLRTVAIVDEQPESQYLYPEFLLAQAMFERAGVAALIADPEDFELRSDDLYCRERRIDLVYNRLTDFSLARFPVLHQAWLQGLVVLTPHPQAYARYADKRILARLSDAAELGRLGAAAADIATLQAGVPQTRLVGGDAESWWAGRKQWFFKPNSGYGSKGAYRGEKLTRRVFDEILQGDYVAQRLAAPGERCVSLADGTVATLKYDVRCYVYDGELQLVAARLYQGQTTNFRTPGGGFGEVRVVDR